MAGNPHPAYTMLAIAPSDDVDKEAFLAIVKANVNWVVATNQDIRDTNFAGQLLITVKASGDVFRLDTTDTTTADDDVATIHDANGLRFKRISGYVVTLPVPIAAGGTAAATASGARTSLAVPGLATPNAFTDATEATTGGAGALTTAGGIYAAKKGVFIGGGYYAGEVILKANGLSGGPTGEHLLVYSDDPAVNGNITALGFANGGGIMHVNMARGTLAAPEAVLKDDITGGIGSRFYDGTNWLQSSPTSIHWVMSENASSSAHGSYLRILTTPKGSTTRQERVIVADNGVLVAHGATGTWDMTSDANTDPVGSANGTRILATAYGNVAVTAISYGANAGFRAGVAGGTPSAPSASPSTAILAFMGGHGYGATGWSSGTRAILTFNAAETWTDAAQGTYITLGTTSIGSLTRTERVRVTDSGNVGVGMVPSYTLDIAGPGRFASYTVGTLPAGSAGVMAYCTTNTTPGYAVLAVHNGSVWKAAGTNTTIA